MGSYINAFSPSAYSLGLIDQNNNSLSLCVTCPQISLMFFAHRLLEFEKICMHLNRFDLFIFLNAFDLGVSV